MHSKLEENFSKSVLVKFLVRFVLPLNFETAGRVELRKKTNMNIAYLILLTIISIYRRTATIAVTINIKTRNTDRAAPCEYVVARKRATAKMRYIPV
mmetsp:Transcript_27530/g.39408  ORF Transcript_27530/g.39408 Transcript_27530/m.39408 type:complete len:97 (+) Transcript_27530:404-694(+)